MEKGYVVSKSNKLITANYDLSLQEQKIILTLASMVQPQDTELKEYEFRIKDFIQMLGLKDQSKYTELPKITRELKKKVFDIREGSDILQVSWLGCVRYKTKEGTLILSLDKGLKPYMLQLKELYTSYKLDNILTMRSKYSIRIYELLKSNQFKKSWEIPLDELKSMIGATEKSYSIYQNVKNRIIIKSQKELKEKTDIFFDFEEIKTGRKVTSIRFYIKNNSTKVNDPVENSSKKTPLEEMEKGMNDVKTILENRVSDSESLSIYGSAEGDIDIIRKSYTYCKDKKTDNFVGYIIKIIKSIKDGTFNEPQRTGGKVSNTSNFNNFEGRDYNTERFKLMEKCLNGTATDEERKVLDKMKGNI